MSNLILNKADRYDWLNITLTENNFPIAYANKLKCLMNSGLTEVEARDILDNNPIELELYYEIGAGLMAVEAEAVEAGIIYSPYSGEQYVDPEAAIDIEEFSFKTIQKAGNYLCNNPEEIPQIIRELKALPNQNVILDYAIESVEVWEKVQDKFTVFEFLSIILD